MIFKENIWVSSVEIEEIREKVVYDKYEICFHAEKERYDEDIPISDLEAAISNGEILEDYTNDPRGPSCLILGFTHNRPIHIVCGYTGMKWIRIITVYIPKLPKWANERTRVKGGKE